MFTRDFEHFKQHGTMKRAEGSGRKSVCESVKVQAQNQENPQMPRQMARNTDLSTFIVHKTLRSVTKLKLYKFYRSQQLKEEHKEQPMAFCQWIIDNNIDSQKIIFTDQKNFVLRPNPNKQTAIFWGLHSA